MERFLSELWSMKMYLQRRTGGVCYFRMSIPTGVTAAYGDRGRIVFFSVTSGSCVGLNARPVQMRGQNYCSVGRTAEKRPDGKIKGGKRTLFSSLYLNAW